MAGPNPVVEAAALSLFSLGFIIYFAIAAIALWSIPSDPSSMIGKFKKMEERELHHYMCVMILACGASSFVALAFLNAPYGRYSTAVGWGPLINAKLAWFIMESPNLWMSALCFWLAGNNDCTKSLANRILLAAFCVHYLNRSIAYPLRMRASAPMPVSVMFMAFSFCTINGYLQARNLCSFHVYDAMWLTDPRFLIGLLMWAHGFSLNLQADGILRNLRQPGDTERYKIPRGGLFELVSGANFCAEIYEWAGFAVASWSFPALTFALFTFLNTAPRGVAHHKWYLEKFPNYPKHRKGVIPYVW